MKDMNQLSVCNAKENVMRTEPNEKDSEQMRETTLIGTEPPDLVQV